MKNLLLVALIAFTGNVYAQVPSVQWQKSLGGSDIESAQCINRTSDSGYIVTSTAGSSNGDLDTNKGGYDCWIVKLSSWGNIVWKKSLGGSASDYGNGAVQTTDGGYIVGAKTQSNDGDVSGNHGGFDVWVVKLDDTGHIQWQKAYGGTLTDRLNAIEQTSDGGYIFTGTSESSDGDVAVNHGNEDVWVVKLSATGTIEWEKTYGGSSEEDGVAIRQTPDGGYILAATTRSTDGDVTGNHGGDDVWILKLSSTGTVQWSQCYGGTGTEQDGDHAYPGNIDLTADGGYVFAGFTNSTDGDVTGYHGGSFYDYWVVKLTSTGAIQWQKTLGGTGDDDGYFVQQTTDGGYIVSGTSNSFDGDLSGGIGTFDYWIVKLTSAGNIQWQKKYGGTLDDYGFCIRATSDSEFVIAGYSKSNDVDVSGNHGDYDSWVLKLAYCSLPTTTAISGPTSVCVGSSITLSDATTGGTWYSGNGNVAVSGNVVTGLYPGYAPIFYTKTNSCGTGGATYYVSIAPLPTPVITRTDSILSTTVPFATYQWLKDGNPIPGATNATYTTKAHDTFTVIVTNASGCSDTAAVYVTGLGVAGTYTATNIALAPNPTTGMIYIQGISNATVHVYNIWGQLIRETNNSNSVSLTELPRGIYLVRIFDEQGVFVKQEKVMKE